MPEVTPTGGDQGVVNSTPSGQQSVGTGGDPNQTQQTPTPIEVSDDTLLTIKGLPKPVKFGEHVGGLRSQFTRASQEAAKLRKAIQERDEKLKSFEQARTQNQQPGGSDILDQLRAQPYLDGKTTADIVTAIGQQFEERDRILVAALNQVKQLQDIVRGLHGESSNKSFDAKIAKFVQDGGYSPEWNDVAKKLYMAYEGDDLDEQFPSILADYVAQTERLITAKREAQVRGARRSPFVPGQGGNGKPSQPLQIKPDISRKDLVDQLWDHMQSMSGDET